MDQSSNSFLHQNQIYSNENNDENGVSKQRKEVLYKIEESRLMTLHAIDLIDPHVVEGFPEGSVHYDGHEYEEDGKDQTCYFGEKR